MATQCNTCGGFEKLHTCQHCSTIICEMCRLHHEPFCEQLTKVKKRGEGPTIANAPAPPHRAGHETPALPALVTIPSAAPLLEKRLLESLLPIKITLPLSEIQLAKVDHDIDIGLNALADLIKES